MSSTQRDAARVRKVRERRKQAARESSVRLKADMEEEGKQAESVDVGSAKALLLAVDKHFNGGDGYTYFLGLLRQYGAGKLTAKEVGKMGAQLLAGAPALLRRFKKLVPEAAAFEAQGRNATTEAVRHSIGEDKDDITSTATTGDPRMQKLGGEGGQTTKANRSAEKVTKPASESVDQSEDAKSEAAAAARKALATARGLKRQSMGAALGDESNATALSHPPPPQCPEGFWRRTAGGHSCVPLTVCNFTTEFESAAAGASADRICTPLSVCTGLGITSFELLPPSRVADRRCKPATPCSRAQWESRPLTAVADRVCSEVSVCTDHEWEAAPPSASSDRICKPQTVCSANELEIEAPTATSDRRCMSLVKAASVGGSSGLAAVEQLLSRRGVVDPNEKVRCVYHHVVVRVLHDGPCARVRADTRHCMRQLPWTTRHPLAP
jgi:hypothetical protein